MKFIHLFRCKMPSAALKKAMRIMKVIVIIITTFLMQVSAATFGQNVTIHNNRITLIKAFEEIRKQTGYTVLYKHNLINKVKPIGLNMTNVQLEQALEQILKGKDLDFSIQDKAVIIKEKEQSFFERVIARFQRIDIKGLVVDSAGNPISGATVKVKGFKQSTTTDGTGRFGLANVEDNATIVISFLGFKTVELPANGNFGRIVLSIITSDLDEVAIVNKGYYQTKKELETGNVARVTAKEISQQPVSNPLAALAGRVPGLEISQRTGAPGSAFNVQIRGRSSIGQGSDPLYIIDGIQYPSQMPNSEQGGIDGSRNGNLRGGNPLNFINISDIESIDVLKDADATAIYGSRGAGGVILITTKKGNPGNGRVEVNFYSGIGRATNFMKLLNTDQYLEVRREAFKNDGVTIPSAPTSNYDLTFWDQSRYTNWQKVLMGNTAHYNDLQTSLSGGSGKTNYKFGTGYHNESSVFATSGGDRKISANFNLNTVALNDKLKATITASYTSDKNDVSPVDFVSSHQLAPNAPNIYNADGTFNWAPVTVGARGTWTNPLASATRTYLGKTGALNSNITLAYTIIPDLIFQAIAGYNNFKTNEVTTVPTTTSDPARLATFNSSGGYLGSSNSAWMVEPQLSYSKTFHKFKLSGLLGSTFQENISDFSSADGTTFSNDVLITNPQAAGTYIPRGYFVKQYKYNALYSRLNINYNDKYIVNLTGRRDGTSRFGPANQWANFGSLGLAYIFSNEATLKSLIPALSFGKLRFSYGSTGNDQLPDYRFLNLYTLAETAYAGVKGLSPSGLFNPYLEWEITKKMELGTELGFFDDRINLSLSYYRNRSGNQLLTAQLPFATGFANIETNIPAVIQNNGWEVILNTQNVQKKNFKWLTSINLSAPKNKLIEFNGIENASYNGTLIVGQPINIKKVYKTNGVDPSTGLLNMLNKDGVVTKPILLTQQDKVSLINTAPLLSGGFQNTFTYKGFELNFFLQYVKQNARTYIPIPGGMFNFSTKYLDRWQKPGDIAKFPKFTQNLTDPSSDIFNDWALGNSGDSDIAWEDASYLRLKNLSFSWKLPATASAKLGLYNFRIYAQGQNLLTVTKYSGFDPETQSTFLPPIKVFTLGFQTSF